MAPLISQSDPKERAKAWKRLQELEDRAMQTGLRRMTSEEVLELGRLYRRAAADLAQSRSLGLDPREAALLNGLVGRAYGLIYTPERGGAASVVEFFTREFPRCFRRNFGFIAAAFLAFAAGALVGVFATLLNRDTVDVLMGPGWSRGMEELGQRHRAGHNWLPAEMRPFASSFIMTNNIGLSCLVFAGGILLGIPTLLFLFRNTGIMMGTIAVAVAQHHTAYEFWGFVAPHGVLELPAIFVAGGAGLMLGYALINPGEYSRRTALRMAAPDAVLLVFGVAAMLVIAGTIEAFFSPVLIPPALKLLVAALTFTAEIAYFVFAGRGDGGVGYSVIGVRTGPVSLNTEHRTPNTEHLPPGVRPLPPL
jgi:uncharacterized membrane protein SpoIIM required for sporulation